MRRGGGRLFGLAVLLLTSGVAAQSADDVFGIALPEESVVSLVDAALYADDTRGARSFTLVAPRATIQWHETVFLRAEAPGLAPAILLDRTDVSWEVTEVRLALVEGDHAGWLGAMSAAEIHAAGPVDLTAALLSRIGRSEGTTQQGDDRPTFAQSYEGPHLASSPVSGWRAEGPLHVKITGLDVSLRSFENDSLVRTGRVQAPSGEERTSWLVVEAEEAIVEADVTAQPLARAATLAWTGTAQVLGPTPRTLAGAYEATLDPAVVDGRAVLAIAAVETAPRAAPGAAGLAAGGPLSTALLVGAVVGGVATWAFVRRRRSEPLTADECARLAEAAAEDERYEEALEWIRRARGLSPGSRRLLMDEADFTVLAGRPDEAIGLLRASPRGADVDFRLARLVAVDAEDEAAALLVRALAEAPALVMEAEAAVELRAVARRPEVRRAFVRARSAMERP